MTFEEFQNKVIGDELRPGSRTMHYRNWTLDGKFILQERVCNIRRAASEMTSAQLFAMAFHEIKEFYYPDSFYHDKAAADSDAECYSGEILEEPYSDPESPSWGIRFTDFDQALRYCYDKLVENKILVSAIT